MPFRLLLTVALALGACRSRPEAAAPSPATRTATTEEQCRACSGVWGKHGLAQTDSCLCAARDAGKRCRDGKECEGDCIADGEVQVTAAGPPRRGHHLGRCSKQTTTFGCHRFIADGALAAGPVLVDEEVPTMCVD